MDTGTSVPKWLKTSAETCLLMRSCSHSWRKLFLPHLSWNRIINLPSNHLLQT